MSAQPNLGVQVTTFENPMGINGFEFVEFAAPAGQGAAMRAYLGNLGFAPLVALGGLLALPLLLRDRRPSLGQALLRLWWAWLIAAAVGLVTALGTRALPGLFFGLAAWLAFGSFAPIVERIRLFRIPARDSVARLRGLSLSAWGACIAHAGMALTVAGIAAMSMAHQEVVLIKPGQTIHFGGYDWTLRGVATEQGPNFTARVATLEVGRNGHLMATLHPSRRTFPVAQTTTTDTAIETNGLRDLYTVLGDERDGGAVMRLHDNPLAPWIWLGALVMSLGGFLSLADRRLRVGAPARRPANTVPA